MSDIYVLDYGAGNIRSIQNMIRRNGAECRVATSPEDIERAAKLILPGVGAFHSGMALLTASGMRESLEDAVLSRGVPALGICLGAQLMTKRSDEGDVAGLGWIDAETVAFDRTRLKERDRVPHMGWAETVFCEGKRMSAGMETGQRFYFVHSYHFRLGQDEDALCRSFHGYPFVSGFEARNIVGLQFHPEKSHSFGKAVFTNFIEGF